MGDSWKKDPAFRQQRISWLRARHKEPLRVRARQVLGKRGPSLLAKLADATGGPKRYDAINAAVWPVDFDFNARAILRRCKKFGSMERRIAYVLACIERAAQPPLPDEPEFAWDVLDDWQIRALSREDFAAALREVRDYEAALAKKDRSGIDALIAKIGEAKAQRLLEMVYAAFPPERSMKADYILGKAAEARNAGSYVRACIKGERERKKRR